MTIDASDDHLHVDADPAFRDAVTFGFGDRAAALYGTVRISHGSAGCDAVAVLYAGSKPVAAGAGNGDAATGDSPAWDDVSAAGVRSSVVAPLRAWTVAFEDTAGAFDLRFEACSAPAELDGESAVGRAGGMRGYEQLCRVTGTVREGGRTRQVRCLGQRGQLWGSPDPGRIALSRSLSAWLGEDRALMLTAVRPAKAKGHFDELLAGFVFEAGEPVAIDDPRLSTTYDAEQRQRRAGLELWMDEEADHARRMAGEVLCGTSVDLGDHRLDSAFFAWRMEGREGVGRYDVLRRTDVKRRR